MTTPIRCSPGRARSNGANPVVVISNMTPVPRDNYRVPMPKAGKWSERINTDAGWYGGSNTGNQGKVVAHAERGDELDAGLCGPLSCRRWRR